MTTSYIATDGDIRKLAKGFANGVVAIEQGWDTYFKYLVGTVQHTLDIKPPKKRVPTRAISPEQSAAQVAALREVHTRWLGIVTEELRAKGFRGDDVHSRTAKYRSSASELLTYLKRGKDVGALVPATVTKAKLSKENAVSRAKELPAGVRPGLLAKKLQGEAVALTDHLRELSLVDRGQALALAEASLLALTGLVTEIGMASTPEAIAQLSHHAPPVQMSPSLHKEVAAPAAKLRNEVARIAS